MVQIFKGYIPTMGKNPIEKYKNRNDFYTLDDVTKLESYGGVLKNEVIQIDVDDKNQSDKLLKIIENLNINCNILETTRGKHFYFNNTGIERRKQGFTTPIGIKIDVGLGSQNAVVPLKINGELRQWIKDVEKLDSLPVWLNPLDKKKVDFNTMEEGDGRNQALFNYILRLQTAGMSKDEIKDTIKIINQYILKQPLNDSEVNTILRDDAFLKETFYIKNKLQYEKLAKYLIANENIVKINEHLHIYTDGYYSSNPLKIESLLLKYIKNSTKTVRKEVVEYLKILCVDEAPSSTKYIVVANGVYNTETNELLDYSPKFIIRNKINYDYNPHAYHELTDKTLNNICCNDKKLRLVLEEMVGYTLLRRNEIGKAFILTGNGSNGKSTFLKMIKQLLSEENTSSVALQELSDRFKTYQLEGKLANIGDDIPNNFIPDDSAFKKLTTGETINVERKGQDPYDMNNYSTLIFAANELPRINDLSDGLKRRIQFVPFNAKFNKNNSDYDPYINDKVTTSGAMEYLLKIAIEGLQRIILNHSISNSVACDEVWKEYEQINNPVLSFMEDYKVENEAIKDVYRNYMCWCIESGLKHLSKIMFSKEIRKQGYDTKQKKIDGRNVKVFILKGNQDL